MRSRRRQLQQNRRGQSVQQKAWIPSLPTVMENRLPPVETIHARVHTPDIRSPDQSIPYPLTRMIDFISTCLERKIQLPTKLVENDIFSSTASFALSIEEYLTRLVKFIEPGHITAAEITVMGIYLDRYLAATKQRLTQKKCLLFAGNMFYISG
jgi:hypothetical protein